MVESHQPHHSARLWRWIFFVKEQSTISLFLDIYIQEVLNSAVSDRGYNSSEFSFEIIRLFC